MAWRRRSFSIPLVSPISKFGIASNLKSRVLPVPSALTMGGHWGSEPGPKPRDARQLALELHSALKQANIPPPYIFVGYSMGGIYSRVFARMFPDEVSGIVFIDPSRRTSWNGWQRNFPK